MQADLSHCTVLLNEAVDALSVQPDGHYVDATFGRGGHSRLILAGLSPLGRLTVFDKDPLAIEAAGQVAATDARLHVRHELPPGLHVPDLHGHETFQRPPQRGRVAPCSRAAISLPPPRLPG